MSKWMWCRLNCVNGQCKWCQWTIWLGWPWEGIIEGSVTVCNMVMSAPSTCRHLFSFTYGTLPPLTILSHTFILLLMTSTRRRPSPSYHFTQGDHYHNVKSNTKTTHIISPWYLKDAYSLQPLFQEHHRYVNHDIYSKAPSLSLGASRSCQPMTCTTTYPCYHLSHLDISMIRQPWHTPPIP